MQTIFYNLNLDDEHGDQEHQNFACYGFIEVVYYFWHAAGNNVRAHVLYIRSLTITNWRLLWSLHVKPLRILGGHSEKIEKFYKFLQKSETSSHQSNNSNYNNHQICYLF